jgi:hypothetical protein
MHAADGNVQMFLPCNYASIMHVREKSYGESVDCWQLKLEGGSKRNTMCLLKEQKGNPRLVEIVKAISLVP